MEKKRGGWWALWCVVAMIAVFIAYPLSLGPVLWFAEKLGVLHRMDDVLYLFYAPLFYAVKFLPHDAQAWYGRS